MNRCDNLTYLALRHFVISPPVQSHSKRINMDLGTEFKKSFYGEIKFETLPSTKKHDLMSTMYSWLFLVPDKV